MTDRDDKLDSTGRALMSRRRFAQAGLASAGLVLGSGALAFQQRQPTAESPMGPFYPLRRPAESDADLTRLAGRSGRASGTVIELTGRVLDMRGNPIRGATLELWQANAAGRYAHPADVATAPLDPNFQGYASVRTDAAGAWRIVTVKPGGYDSPIGHRPPHLHFDLRGGSARTIAQMYFPEDAPGNAADTLYRALGESASTSVAVRDSADPSKYRWDIVLMT
jgi:protocatechuate 3,4-dioxygenase beta subunit